jgi:CRISPR-associated protein (TIGR03986 family)
VAEFINPYTFVPLPAAIGRAQPPGHHCAEDGNVSGTMTVQWVLKTPLLLPKAHPAVQGGRVVIPGSSVKGAVRSLHEALMGGCLRVVDEDFVPMYRQPAIARDNSWSLAVVTRATRQGRATHVRLTARTTWVPVEVITTALGRVPRTGDMVDIEDSAIELNARLDRDEVTDPDAVTAGDGWAVLVGDSGTRLKSKAFFCAAGQQSPDDNEREVAGSASSEYVELCDGTNDLKLIRQKPDAYSYKGWRIGRVFAEVRWGGKTVGERRRVTGRLWPDDVVWAQVNPATGQVEHLAMAAIWRVPGDGALSERIPEAVRACQNPESLCLSCRLFGSADTITGESGREASQRSYAGHVRVGDATADAVTTLPPVRLAPLGSPRPGAGQFYLQITNSEPASDETQLPAAYWGSERDHPEARLVRGRKLYWHGDAAAQQLERHIAREGQRNEDMTGQRHLVPPSTVFTQEITFDNVRQAELASLLLTLLPSLVLPRTEGLQSAEYWLRLGGGKPFGLGSCAVTVTDFRWQDARKRYLGQDPVNQDPRKFVNPLVGQVAQLADHPVLKHWPTLSRILRADAVDPALIWYPLGGEWGDEKNRDRAFRFFNRTSGRYLGHRKEPIVALPDPDPAKGHSQRMRTV